MKLTRRIKRDRNHVCHSRWIPMGYFANRARKFLTGSIGRIEGYRHLFP